MTDVLREHPIPDKYKFDNPEEHVDSITSLLHDICDNFKSHQDEFESYRQYIKGEKEKFNTGIISFIQRIKNDV